MTAPLKPDDEPTGQHPVTKEVERKYLTLQTLVILLGIAGSILGGARWVVTSSWAQAKEHADAGISVLRAEFDAHKREESSERDRTRGDVQLMRVEQYDMRKELRSLYDYQKTGRPQPTLEQPLPPPPKPTPAKDGGQ